MIVNTEGPLDAKIMLVGEAPGEEEDKIGRPFVGYAGHTLDNMLGQAGISRHQCLVTNVARERPPANKIVHFFEDKKCTIPKFKMQIWIAKLKEEIELYKPNVIVALGSIALWALTGEKKISDFRGYILPCTLVPGAKVLATYHPQAINYEWKLYFQTVLDLRKALRHSEFPEIPEQRQILQAGVDVKTFINYMEECINRPEWDKLSVDIETIQPGSHIEELGIGHSPDFAMSVFLLKGRAPALPEKDELLLWQTFARLINSKKVIMQNGSYDMGVLWYNNGILVKNLYFDTLIAAHICWPELPRDLGFLGSICLDVAPWKAKAIRTQDYNPADVANTFGIAEVLSKEIDKQGVRDVFNFEMNLIPVSLMMQLQGIEVDRDKQKELIEVWTVKKDELKKQLDTLIGRDINFNSSKQMQQLLYIELGLPPQYKRRKSVTETRTMTTDANALRTLSRLVPNNPIFNLLLDYKKAELLVRRFLDIELSPQGRVHTSYNITGASSDDEEDTKKTKRSFGRWSSSASIILPYGSGNLQNIPPEARKMYRAKPGWKIIQADYSQAEAVVVAHLTSDHKLIKMFKDSFGLSKTEKKPYDIHKITFAQMAGIDVSQVTKEQRIAGKTVRHAPLHLDTEVLTDDGWKKITTINLDDYVLTVNPVTGLMQWENDCELVNAGNHETMILFSGRGISQCVTSEHKMGFFTSYGTWIECTAKEALKYDRNRFPVSGICFDGIDCNENLLKLAVSIQADGFFKQNNTIVGWTIKKERKIANLIAILSSLNINYSVYKSEERSIYTFTVHTKDISDAFQFLDSKHEFNLNSLLALSIERRITFLNEIFKWDGSLSANRRRYVSKQKHNAEVIATIAHISGFRAYIRTHSHDTWMAEINKPDLVGRKSYSYETYGKDAYCLTTKAGWFLVRYNGSISITGNTSYSAGPQVLANRLGIKLGDAKQLMELYHRANPALRMWYQAIQQELKSSRVLTNLFGRKHKFLDRWGDSLFRSAYSYKPQSTIGDLLNKALLRLYDSLLILPYEVIIMLQLHDALYVMVEEGNIDKAIKHLRDQMLIPLNYNNQDFTIDVDFAVGDSWGETKEVEVSWRNE